MTLFGCAAPPTAGSISAYYGAPDGTDDVSVPLEQVFAAAPDAEPRAMYQAAAPFAQPMPPMVSLPDAVTVREDIPEPVGAPELQAAAPPEPEAFDEAEHRRAVRALPVRLRSLAPPMKMQRFRDGRGREALYVRIDAPQDTGDTGDRIGMLVAVLAARESEPLVLLHAGGLQTCTAEGAAWIRAEVARDPKRALAKMEHGMRHYATRLRMGQLPADAQLWLRQR